MDKATIFIMLYTAEYSVVDKLIRDHSLCTCRLLLTSQQRQRHWATITLTLPLSPAIQLSSSVWLPRETWWWKVNTSRVHSCALLLHIILLGWNIPLLTKHVQFLFNTISLTLRKISFLMPWLASFPLYTCTNVLPSFFSCTCGHNFFHPFKLHFSCHCLIILLFMHSYMAYSF